MRSERWERRRRKFQDIVGGTPSEELVPPPNEDHERAASEELEPAQNKEPEPAPSKELER